MIVPISKSSKDQRSTLKIMFQGLFLPKSLHSYGKLLTGPFRQTHLSPRVYILLLRRLHVHLRLLLVCSHEIRQRSLLRHPFD